MLKFKDGVHHEELEAFHYELFGETIEETTIANGIVIAQELLYLSPKLTDNVIKLIREAKDA